MTLTTVYHSGTVQVNVSVNWHAASLDQALRAIKWLAPEATPILRPDS